MKNLFKTIDTLRTRRREFLNAKAEISALRRDGLIDRQIENELKDMNDKHARFYAAVQDVLTEGALAENSDGS